METSIQPKKTYIPALDGLRAVAILAVMGYHATLAGANGGFIGVDVFFTLSGFLITRSLWKEFNAEGTIRLKNFYVRRALRLLPALYIFLAVHLLYELPGRGFGAIEESLIIALNLTNWVRAFNLFPMPSMNHMWSLAIEEQFYLLWPLLLLFLLQLRLGINRIFLIVLGLIGLLWLDRAYLISSGISIDRIYNGLDTRAGPILLGCALALTLYNPAIQYRVIIGLIKRHYALFVTLVLAIFGSLVLLAQRNLVQTYYWLPEVIGLLTCLVILDVLFNEASIINSVLSCKPLVRMGRISYGIYLWHFPIYAYMVYNMHIAPLITFVVGGVISVGIAYVSYRFVEQPILNLKVRFSPVHSQVPVQ